MSDETLVPGHPDCTITDEGLVIRDGEEILPHVDLTGYSYISIKGERFALHRLVATAFHGPPKKGQVCRHLDGDPGNNRADNLAWGTHRQNQADRQRHKAEGKPSTLSKQELVMITIKATKDEREAWEAAAERSSMSRHAWMKLMLCIACGRSSVADFVRRMKATRKASEENQPIPYALKSEVGVDNNTHDKFAALATRACHKSTFASPQVPGISANSTPGEIAQWLHDHDPDGEHAFKGYDLFGAWAAVEELLGD